jgi:hypothetical protein
MTPVQVRPEAEERPATGGRPRKETGNITPLRDSGRGASYRLRRLARLQGVRGPSRGSRAPNAGSGPVQHPSRGPTEAFSRGRGDTPTHPRPGYGQGRFSTSNRPPPSGTFPPPGKPVSAMQRAKRPPPLATFSANSNPVSQ